MTEYVYACSACEYVTDSRAAAATHGTSSGHVLHPSVINEDDLSPSQIMERVAARLRNLQEDPEVTRERLQTEAASCAVLGHLWGEPFRIAGEVVSGPGCRFCGYPRDAEDRLPGT
ncbi:hypothetical protein FJV41_31260 [Myxococcus llanfairpwllgwyngyllgogerychwyrndrobwllllantysiliogogogochensis]|uniref:Uncharacterized protein n=1 Tax=Myxococcus llanfairpwllgwyngyllgogerychwyrndrobwllllantysiliogogogochensis TaxID=2590453 RepID=A0A540WSU3_9BACT|nr:hypothetical protein [Myxococcus llanfairpwllgwyngyllgogerychwyrndrobwllllantysiliogogogochensis]TQF12007.1 hypothetical protein FJV41_31260 [Myxococcus llanfairpwllgwyngyllgogerychwyrndrobwllllantysiliogogogochensis]